MARLRVADYLTPPERERLTHALGELCRLGGLVSEAVVGYGVAGDISLTPTPVGVEPCLTVLHRVSDGSAFFDKLPPRLISLFTSREKLPLPGRPLYANDDDTGRVVITVDEGRVHSSADPLAMAAYLFGQDEERRHPHRRDQHGRLSAKVSALPKLLWERPWLDIWARFLAEVLSLNSSQNSSQDQPATILPRHPDGAGWAVALTHDVDSLGERSLGRAMRLFAAGTLKLSGKRIKAGGRMLRLLTKSDRHDCLDLCQQADAPSKGSYYFHAGRRGYLDPDYQLRNHQKILKLLAENGQELGLHYGFETRGDAVALTTELAEFTKLTGQASLGGRAHYLHLSNAADLATVAEVGLRYDSTLGFPDEPGFRLASGGPLRLPKTGLWELPLVVMDGTLFGSDDEAVDVEAVWERTKAYLDAARQAGSAITLLWHQRVFGAAYPGWGEVYRLALDYAREGGAWLGPAGELIDYAEGLEIQ